MAKIETPSIKPETLAIVREQVSNLGTAVALGLAVQYDALVALILALPLNVDGIVKAFGAEMDAQHGEGSMRHFRDCVSHARVVAYGGTRKGKDVPGFGMDRVKHLCETNANVAALRDALAKARPAKLINAPRGPKDRKPFKVTKPASVKDAFAAARVVLQFALAEFADDLTPTQRSKVDAALAAIK